MAILKRFSEITFGVLGAQGLNTPAVRIKIIPIKGIETLMIPVPFNGPFYVVPTGYLKGLIHVSELPYSLQGDYYWSAIHH